MGHRGPVLRPRCILPERAQTQYYSIRPQGYIGSRRIKSINNPNDNIGNQTRHLPAFNLVLEQNASPRDPRRLNGTINTDLCWENTVAKKGGLKQDVDCVKRLAVVLTESKFGVSNVTELLLLCLIRRLG
jgi:hypothetical protein